MVNWYIIAEQWMGRHQTLIFIHGKTNFLNLHHRKYVTDVMGISPQSRVTGSPASERDPRSVPFNSFVTDQAAPAHSVKLCTSRGAVTSQLEESMLPHIPTSIMIYDFKQGKWAKPPHNANCF